MRYCPDVIGLLRDASYMKVVKEHPEYDWVYIGVTEFEIGAAFKFMNLKRNLTSGYRFMNEEIQEEIRKDPKLLEAQILWEMMDDGNKRRLLAP